MITDTSSAGRGQRRQVNREQFWRRMLRDLAGSGQCIRAFCRQRQLSEPSFYAWRRTLAQRDAASQAARTTAAVAPAFLPIRLTGQDTAPIEIVLPEGHCIRLHRPVDRAALIEILAALQSNPIAEP